MDSLRTFIALVLPDAAVEALEQVQQELASRTEGIRWVKPRNIHLTLEFLGATASGDIGSVAEVLQKTAVRFEPFAFDMQGIGAFPNSRNPKVVWAGMRQCDRLAAFQDALVNGLAALGIAKEKKPFSPHITLGRVRDGRGRSALRPLLEKRGSEQFGSFTADRVVFFQSDLQPAGPLYSVLEECMLKNT